MIFVGQEAPHFRRPDQSGKEWSLTDSRGQWLLIYFYPKDDTPGCTKEACSFRDSWATIQKEGLIVFGVSTDSVASHRTFKEKYDLPFILLADEDKKMVEAYGVWEKKKFMGKEFMGTNRISFLIDPIGVIRKIYDTVTPETHAMDVLNDLETFKK